MPSMSKLWPGGQMWPINVCMLLCADVPLEPDETVTLTGDAMPAAVTHTLPGRHLSGELSWPVLNQNHHLENNPHDSSALPEPDQGGATSTKRRGLTSPPRRNTEKWPCSEGTCSSRPEATRGRTSTVSSNLGPRSNVSSAGREEVRTRAG